MRTSLSSDANSVKGLSDLLLKTQGTNSTPKVSMSLTNGPSWGNCVHLQPLGDQTLMIGLWKR